MGRITKKKAPLTPTQKQKLLEKQHTEWEAEDYEYSIKFCFTEFMVDRRARRNSEETIAAYYRMFKKLETMFDNLKKGATCDDVPVAWLTNKLAQPVFMESLGKVSPQTINHYLRHFRAFGNYCEERGYIQGFSCPIKEVEPPIKDVYSDAELKKLLAPVKDKDNFVECRNHCIITLILATGARSHTIRSLRVGDVDLENGYINFNTTKAHKTIRLGLEKKVHKELITYITDWRSIDYDTGEQIPPTAYLFPASNEERGELSKDGLIHSIVKYNKSRGVEKTSLHLLRHTFAKNWITSGGDIISLARVLTHSELEMVKRYSNLYASDVKEEIEQHSTLSRLNAKTGKGIKKRPLD